MMLPDTNSPPPISSPGEEPTNGRVPLPPSRNFLGRFWAFAGPAFLVSVGYMDPGNWATDLAGGAQFGYRLLWVILMANLMAILFQTLSARLGIATGLDLARACREYYPRPVTWILWVICEIAIVACDLAEVLGSAIGLNLLFGLPLLWGVLLTGFDVLLLLSIQSLGVRRLEAVIVSLVATIGACFALEMFLSKPSPGQMLSGLVPGGLSGDALYIAIGIIGATVMPHNLYLHSALVQSRDFPRTPEGLSQASWYNFFDCVIAMNGAFLVNGAILALAAVTFHSTGNTQVASIQEAHTLLAPLLGSKIAPIAFAIALLAAGQSSTITGTLAGQIVLEGFLELRLKPWLRRLISRLLAIVPAAMVIGWQGDAAIDSLLVLSQVILSLQLSFALVPLIHFTRDRRWMGRLATPLWLHGLAWCSAFLIMFLNLKLVGETILHGWAAEGLRGALVRWLLFPTATALLVLLVWMLMESRWRAFRLRMVDSLAAPVAARTESPPAQPGFRRIAVAMSLSPSDETLLSRAISLAQANGAELILFHVLPSVTGKFLGLMPEEVEAAKAVADLSRVASILKSQGLQCRNCLCIGDLDSETGRFIKAEKVDLMIAGHRGHSILSSLLFGSHLTQIRRAAPIPVLSIPTFPEK